MSLNSALSIASSGLGAVQYQLSVASQNIANASTAGYVAETAAVSSRTASGQSSGVVTGLTSRVVDNALQQSLYSQNAQVASFTATQNALAPIGALQGSTSADAGGSGTLADLAGNLKTALIALQASPSSAIQQATTVAAADSLADKIQATSSAYQTARQSAQDAVVAGVDSVNKGLQLIGTLSDQIMAIRSRGLSSADLENQRAAAMDTLSGDLSVHFTETSTGDMLVSTDDGLVLPTRPAQGELDTSNAVVGIGDTHPGTIPGVILNGRDVTGSLAGGGLGAQLVLRDQTLPTMQAELDSFASTMSSRFAAQGLTLFTGAAGAPAGTDPTVLAPNGQVGFAATIQVDPDVKQNPALLRDGNVTVAGSAQGATAFTPGYTTADSTTLLNRLVNYAMGAQVQAGVTQPSVASSGLGLSGTLSWPSAATGDVANLASLLAAAQASTIGAAASGLSGATDMQTALRSRVSAVSDVSVDKEMANVVALQNAYSANAKVISTVQTMFSALLSAIN
ncbi:flagellar hook-associated protein FlgK [Rhizosaccharibacter radicis]